jgi:exodeoxyribonuclease VII small subunit
MSHSADDAKRRGKRAREDAPASEPFEAQLDELDRIVATLEEGKLPLDDALTLYERGMRLAQACQERLNTAALRVRQLKLANGASDGAEPDSEAFLLESLDGDAE